MEVLELFELCGCFLELANGLGLFAEVFAWLKGWRNREARTEAKKAGVPAPALDVWNWVVILLAPALVVLLALLILRYSRR